MLAKSVAVCRAPESKGDAVKHPLMGHCGGETGMKRPPRSGHHDFNQRVMTRELKEGEP